MKRIYFLLMGVAVFLSSCNTLTRTARTADTYTNLQSATVVDIIPATTERISHTLTPDLSIRRGGERNIKQAVEHEALVKHGNADILLEPQYVIHRERTLFGSKITSITVSGRPAYYTNFRALHDSVWCNPVFRGVYQSKSQPLSFFGERKIEGDALVRSTQIPASRKRGFTTLVSPFVGFKEVLTMNSGDYFSSIHASGGALVSFGYQLIPRLFVGAGLGVDFYDGGIGSLPVFANARVYLSKKEKSLFVDAKVGSDGWRGGGLFSGASFGYSLGKMEAAFQYLFHEDYLFDYQECYQWGISLNFRF